MSTVGYQNCPNPFQDRHCTVLLLLLHPFNGLILLDSLGKPVPERKTSLDLNEARDHEVLGWQWHQLDHMQTICILLQTDNHTTPHHSMFTGRLPFVMLNKSVTALKAADTVTVLVLKYLLCVVLSGGSIAEWLVYWTQVQKGLGSNRSH